MTHRIGVNKFFAVAILFVLEATLFAKLRIFGMRPELLLIATIFFGLHFGLAPGMEIGAASGILKDLFSINSFGLNTLSFLLAGLLAGLVKQRLTKENFLTQFFFSLICVYIISGLNFLYLTEIAPSGVSPAFWKYVFYKGLYTGALAPFLFFVLSLFFSSRPEEFI